MDKIYLDFQGPPGLDGSVEAGKTVLEHYLVKLLTNVVVNACAAWWSIKELWDYLSNRQTFKEMVRNVRPATAGNPA